MKNFRLLILVAAFFLSLPSYGIRTRPHLEVHYDYLNNKVLIINGKYRLWDGLNEIAVLSLWDYFKLRVIGTKPSNFLTYSTGKEHEINVFFDEDFQKFVLLRRFFEGEILIEYVENFNLKFVFNLRSVINSHCHETDEPSKQYSWPKYIFYPDKLSDVDWLAQVFLVYTQEGHEIKISLDDQKVVSDVYKPELRSDYCKKFYQGPTEDYLFPDFIQDIYLLDQNNNERGVPVEDIFPGRVKKAGIKMPTRCHYESFQGGGDRCAPIWGEGFEKRSRLSE